MSPSRIFILRPVATTLLMAAIMIVGIVAYRFLPLSALPEVAYPTIQVQTFYPGASPDVMTSSVTAPLERQLGQMPGLKQTSSRCSAGASGTTPQFTLDLSLDIAEQEVQAAINAPGNLPGSALPAPPIHAKVNPADAPVLSLALTSKTLPLTTVEDLADTRLAQNISQLPGVGLVSIGGGQRQSVRIRANPTALAAYGLNIDDMRTTVSNGNVNTAKGNFDGPSRSFSINANDQLKSAADYEKLVVAFKNGAPVRLSDVAKVEFAPENNKLAAWYNTTPAVILNIQRQPGANVIKVVEGVYALLPALKASLPPAIDVSVLTDRTVTIRASIRDVEFELTLAVILVVLVIFVFLRNIPATIIPSLSVPLSLIGTFAIPLAVTILISAVVSLTLVPMMCAKLVRHHEPEEVPAWNRRAGEIFDGIIARYGKMLNWVLDRQALTLGVAIATLALTVLLYVLIPKGFFPVQDTGLIQVITEGSQSASYEAMVNRQQALAGEILKDPAVVSLSSFVGVDGSNTTLNTGRMLVNLKPKEQRSDSAAGVIRRLNAGVAGVPGISAYMQPIQDLTIDDRVSRTQYQFVLESANPADLTKWVPRLADRLRLRPQVSDVVSDVSDRGLGAYIKIDRDTAARFGITAATIDNALYDAFGQRIISTIFTESNQYRVIMEADPALQRSPDSLSQIYVPSATGGQVPLSSIARFEERPEPLLVNHMGQFPANTISFNVPRGGSLGSAVKAIRAAEAELGMPASIATTFQGAADAFESSLSNELFLLGAAVLTMYIILGILYESFIHPITILSTLPSAGIGALLALIMVGSDLGVIGIIGIILLIGIVKKNAIMMIDFALDAQRNEGLPPREAIYQACLLRFRPILMTTMAALLSAVPLMLGTGMGSELRHPLGVTIVGGLIVSQVLTLFTTPVIYLAFDRIALRFREKGPAVAKAREAVT